MYTSFVRWKNNGVTFSNVFCNGELEFAIIFFYVSLAWNHEKTSISLCRQCWIKLLKFTSQFLFTYNKMFLFFNTLIDVSRWNKWPCAPTQPHRFLFFCFFYKCDVLPGKVFYLHKKGFFFCGIWGRGEHRMPWSIFKKDQDHLGFRVWPSDKGTPRNKDVRTLPFISRPVDQSWKVIEKLKDLSEKRKDFWKRKVKSKVKKKKKLKVKKKLKSGKSKAEVLFISLFITFLFLFTTPLHEQLKNFILSLKPRLH